MIQKQDESLDEGDLDEQERQPDGKKIHHDAAAPEGDRLCSRLPSLHPQRQQDEQATDDRRLQECRHHHQVP